MDTNLRTLYHPIISMSLYGRQLFGDSLCLRRVRREESFRRRVYILRIHMFLGYNCTAYYLDT